MTQIDNKMETTLKRKTSLELLCEKMDQSFENNHKRRMKSKQPIVSAAAVSENDSYNNLYTLIVKNTIQNEDLNQCRDCSIILSGIGCSYYEAFPKASYYYSRESSCDNDLNTDDSLVKKKPPMSRTHKLCIQCVRSYVKKKVANNLPMIYNHDVDVHK